MKAYDEAAKEYNAAVAKLALPEGAVAFPVLPKEREGMQLVYQGTAATGTAQDHWLCAWEKEWLTVRKDDPAREAGALTQLEKFPSMEAFAQTDNLGKKYFTDDLAAAKRGDPAGFQQYVKTSCG